MTLEAEVTGRFDHAGDANALVYSPLPHPHTYRATRRYGLAFQGSEASVRAFVESTLVEEVSQHVHFGGSPALEGFAFVLDYGFKPGALDLEREMILNYYRSQPQRAFDLQALTITQRIYVFASSTVAPPEKFVRDIVNPAIHRHAVLVGR